MSEDLRRPVAFYAPMKAPDHPNPSGDRRIGRLLIEALGQAGFEARLASRLRTHRKLADLGDQDALFDAAEREAATLIADLAENPPAFWFTYHCYYKAPDLIGPKVAAALSIPYVVAEGYRARKRLTGPYARFARAAEDALDQAAILFHFSHRGYDALLRDQPAGQKLVHLPPFTALGPKPRFEARKGPLRLLTVAMMREGDKFASYTRLAAALATLDGDWQLSIVGDGTARPAVEALFAPFGTRVAFLGRIEDEATLTAVYAAADLFVWPGVNEAFGMVYLEAQAAGLPCIAEDREGVREVIGPTGRLADPDAPGALGAAIASFQGDRAALLTASRAARAYVEGRHGVAAAARRLAHALPEGT